MSRDVERAQQKPYRKRRRTSSAAALEHLVPGGSEMTDDQLEIAISEMFRRPAQK